MDTQELNLGEAASEVMSLNFASWQQRADALYDLIQFENGVDIGDKYPLPEEKKIVVKGAWLKFLVDINYTADDWQAFTTGDYANDCESIARMLNAQLEIALADGADSWLDLYRTCSNIQGDAVFRKAGFDDTEGNWKLRQLLYDLGMPKDVA
jgi:hypothetical protein